MDAHINIVEFDVSQHGRQVDALWREIFAYDAPRNAPTLVIAKKCAVRDGLFFVATFGDAVVGTVMAGYDGHRGWIYSMAVHPGHRHQGIGSRLLSFAEQKLAMLGCVKINLQVMGRNEAARRFYEANGYAVEDRVSMGKELTENIGMSNKAMEDIRPQGMGEDKINSQVFAMLRNVVRNSDERRGSDPVSQALLNFLARACNTWQSIWTLRSIRQIKEFSWWTQELCFEPCTTPIFKQSIYSATRARQPNEPLTILISSMSNDTHR